MIFLLLDRPIRTHRLLPDGRLPCNHDLARARPNLVHRQQRLTHLPRRQFPPTRDGRGHAREFHRQRIVPRSVKMRRLKVRPRGQPFLAPIEHLVDLEVC